MKNLTQEESYSILHDKLFDAFNERWTNSGNTDNDTMFDGGGLLSDIRDSFIKTSIGFLKSDGKSHSMVREICRLFVLQHLSKYCDNGSIEEINSIGFDGEYDIQIDYKNGNSDMYNYETNVLPEIIKRMKI